MIVIAFVAAAGLGTVLRWQSVRWNRPGRRFGTLTVNVVASFALGLLVGASADTVVILGVAHLGSLSTFSTVMREVSTDIDSGRQAGAAAYIALTVTLSVAAAATGIALG
jgi:CrcB protein